MIYVRFTSTKYALLVALSLISLRCAAGQERTITHSEFFQAYRDALAETKKLERKLINSKKVYQDAKIESVEEVITEIVPGRAVRISKNTAEGIMESAQVGDVYYCRDGSKDWQEKKSACLPETIPPRLPPPSGSKSSITRQQGGITVYRLDGEYTTGPSNGLLRKGELRVSVNAKGAIISREWRLFTPSLSSRVIETETYEYDPNIKIEAPIK